jgi:hypothetical protein
MHIVPQGRPRYPFGRRLHHGLAGAVLALVGIVLMVDDRHDWPWPMHRRS